MLLPKTFVIDFCSTMTPVTLSLLSNPQTGHGFHGVFAAMLRPPSLPDNTFAYLNTTRWIALEARHTLLEYVELTC